MRISPEEYVEGYPKDMFSGHQFFAVNCKSLRHGTLFHGRLSSRRRDRSKVTRGELFCDKKTRGRVTRTRESQFDLPIQFRRGSLYDCDPLMADRAPK